MVRILLQGQEKTDKRNYYLTANVQNNDAGFGCPRTKNKKIKVDSNLVLKVNLKIFKPQNMIKR